MQESNEVVNSKQKKGSPKEDKYVKKEQIKFYCYLCKKQYSRKYWYETHCRSEHKGKRHSCQNCGKVFHVLFRAMQHAKLCEKKTNEQASESRLYEDPADQEIDIPRNSDEEPCDFAEGTPQSKTSDNCTIETLSEGTPPQASLTSLINVDPKTATLRQLLSNMNNSTSELINLRNFLDKPLGDELSVEMVRFIHGKEMANELQQRLPKSSSSVPTPQERPSENSNPFNLIHRM